MTEIPDYITLSLTFPIDGMPCKGDRWQGGCAVGYDEGFAEAIHTFEGKHYCSYHSPFDNIYKPCEVCEMSPVLTAGYPRCKDCREIHLEVDPSHTPAGYAPDGLGAPPVMEFNNDEGICSGYEESCSNPVEGNDDFCLDCHSKVATLHGDEKDLQPQKACPGYGEDCGNPIEAADAFCYDCSMARMGKESPRIPS